MKIKKFWMVISKDTPSCTVRHYDKEEAEKEVERLVRKHDLPFILLEAIGYCEPKDVPVLWHKIREGE